MSVFLWNICAIAIDERVAIINLPATDSMDLTRVAYRTVLPARRRMTHWPVLASGPIKYSEIDCLRVSPDGKTLAVGWFPGKVTILQSDSFQEIQTFQALRGRVADVEFTADGKYLVAGGGTGNHKVLPGGQMRVIDLETAKMFRVIDEFYHTVGHVAISPDGNVVAAGTVGGALHLFKFSKLLRGGEK